MIHKAPANLYSWLWNALFQLELIRIVALEKVAGSSPVDHPPNKPAVCNGLLKAERDGKLYEQRKMFG
jgi:hypothetical protein